MAMEPMTIYARINDRAGVVRRLRELVPTVKIDGPDDDWNSATVTFTKWLRKRTLTFHYDADYHAEPTWSTQMNGMERYFSRFPETERKSTALLLMTTFRLCLGLMFDPDYDADDPRLEVVYEITSLLDGVLFSPSALRDARGRVLFGAGGWDEEDPQAAWPKVIAEVNIARPATAVSGEVPPAGETEEDRIEPPDEQRVARRALALTAVTTRAILEQDAQSGNPHTQETYNDDLAWIANLGIDDEFEPNEWEVLQRRPGKLDRRMQIDSTWRLEGLAVLAWALGRFEVPPHDQLVDFHALWESLGWLDADKAGELLAHANLRPREEIAILRNRLFALHWRLRNFRLKPEVIDFAEFARTCWFGPLAITGLPLVEGDLALEGERLDRVSEDLFSKVQSATLERHLAANWLWEGPKRYSETNVST